MACHRSCEARLLKSMRQKVIMKTYYKQHDDALMVEHAGKIDFGLGVPKVG